MPPFLVSPPVYTLPPRGQNGAADEDDLSLLHPRSRSPLLFLLPCPLPRPLCSPPSPPVLLLPALAACGLVCRGMSHGASWVMKSLPYCERPTAVTMTGERRRPSTRTQPCRSWSAAAAARKDRGGLGYLEHAVLLGFCCPVGLELGAELPCVVLGVEHEERCLDDVLHVRAPASHKLPGLMCGLLQGKPRPDQAART